MFTEDTFLISAQNKKFPLSRNNLPKKPQRQFTIVYTEPYTALFPSSTSPIREEHPPRRPPRYKHKSQQRPPSGVSLITLITSEQRLWREFARNIRSERCKEGVYRVTKGSKTGLRNLTVDGGRANEEPTTSGTVVRGRTANSLPSLSRFLILSRSLLPSGPFLFVLLRAKPCRSFRRHAFANVTEHARPAEGKEGPSPRERARKSIFVATPSSRTVL